MRDLLLEALALLQDINHQEFSPPVPRAQPDGGDSSARDLGLDSEVGAAETQLWSRCQEEILGADKLHTSMGNRCSVP